MHRILTVIFAGFTFLATSQTPLIAHKSHAGSSVRYFIDPLSNFGDNPHLRKSWQEPVQLSNETFIPLNDSMMVVEVKDFNQKIIKTDTLPNKKRYSALMFKTFYNDSIIREARMKLYEDEIKQQQEQIKQEEEHKKQLELQQQQINEPASSKKKEKKSYLLFLFGITGGGMLLLKIFGKSRISKTSIA